MNTQAGAGPEPEAQRPALGSTPTSASRSRYLHNVPAAGRPQRPSAQPLVPGTHNLQVD